MNKKSTLLLFTVFSFFVRLTAQNVQLAHNCSDIAASSLKIWVNDTVWINSLSYKNASAQKNFAAGVYTIAVTGTSATSAAQPLAQNVFNVQANQNHFIMLNGLVSASSSTPNSNTHPLVVKDFSTALAGNPSPMQVLIKVYHGEINNSFVTIDIDAVEMPVNYNDFTTPGLYTAAAKTIAVVGEINSLGSYLAPLQSYAGTNINIVSSGGPTESFNMSIVPVAGGTFIPLAHIVSPSGIKEQRESNFFNAGPNPVSELLSLKYNQEKTILNCELRDLNGKRLNDLKSTTSIPGESRIDLAGLDSGIYFLFVQFSDGSRTIRLIKD